MGKFSLICHPKTPARHVRGVTVDWTLLGDGRLELRWQVVGAQGLVVPHIADNARTDGLWQATCFEMFLKGPDKAYREYNFSPSHRWAAYHFADYREGMAQQVVAVPPVISAAREGEHFTCTVTLPAGILADCAHAGLSAVLVEGHGHKSYWALAHAVGDPDFHAASCFTLAIGAAEAP